MPYKNKTRKMKGGKIPTYNDNFFVFDGTYSVIYKNHYIFKTNSVNTITLTTNYEYLESTPEEIELANQNLEKEKLYESNFKDATVFETENIDMKLDYISDFKLLEHPKFIRIYQDHFETFNVNMKTIFESILNCEEKNTEKHREFIESLSQIFLIKKSKNGKYEYSGINAKHNVLNQYSFLYKLKPLIEILFNDEFDSDKKTYKNILGLANKIIDMFPPNYTVSSTDNGIIYPPVPPTEHIKTKKQKSPNADNLLTKNRKTKKQKPETFINFNDNFSDAKITKWINEKTKNERTKYISFINMADMMDVYSSYTKEDKVIQDPDKFETHILTKFKSKLESNIDIKDTVSAYLKVEINEILNLKKTVFDYLKDTTLHYAKNEMWKHHYANNMIDVDGGLTEGSNMSEYEISDPNISKDIALDLRCFLLLFYIRERLGMPSLSMNGRRSSLYPISKKLFVESLVGEDYTPLENSEMFDMNLYPSRTDYQANDRNGYQYSECAGRGLFEMLKLITAGTDSKFHPEYLPETTIQDVKDFFIKYNEFYSMSSNSHPDNAFNDFIKVLFENHTDNMDGLNDYDNPELVSTSMFEHLYYIFNGVVKNRLTNDEIEGLFADVRNPLEGFQIDIVAGNKIRISNNYLLLTVNITRGHTDTTYETIKDIANTNPTFSLVNNKTIRSIVRLSSIDYDDIDTSKVTNMVGLFKNYRYNPIHFSTPDLSKLNTSNVTNMAAMFRDYPTSFRNPIKFDTSKVTNMAMMFSGSNLNQPINFENTSNVKNMQSMFSGCADFNQSVTFDDTSNVTNMGSMFYRCTNFNQPVKFNTSNVTDMTQMFQNCEKFNQPIDFNDTSNVTNMQFMFNRCTNFNQPVNFNTSNVTNMLSMFSFCRSFNQPVEFNTSNVTNMGSMFVFCTNFNQPVNFNTENVTNMESMFEDCFSFDQPVVFRTTNVTNISNMFNNCSRLKQLIKIIIPYPPLETTCNGKRMFANKSTFGTEKRTDISDLFKSCSKDAKPVLLFGKFYKSLTPEEQQCCIKISGLSKYLQSKTLGGKRKTRKHKKLN